MDFSGYRGFCKTENAMITPNLTERTDRNIIIKDKNIILNDNGTLPSFEKLLELKAQYPASHCIAERENAFSALELPDEAEVSGTKEIALREYFFTHSEEDSCTAARAKTLLDWTKKMNFCPKCGSPLAYCKKESAKECPECSVQYFPKIEPCIIVLVKKEDKVLLVRHSYRNQDIFACIAGFIEAGESAEHAVYREVKEEVGITVRNIQYKGSQNWPFPDQLMLAYTADYDSGEFSLQKEEIAEAGWFSKENIPASPKPGSVAYRLIHNLF